MKDKYCSLVRASLSALFVAAALMLNTTAIAQALPGSLWYNGDLNHVNGLPNERDDGLGFGQYAHVFDDFNVPAGQIWMITGLYSNNYDSYPTSTTAVEWSIRQGITTGNGGTLIASGTATGNNFQVIFHNPGDFGYTEYSVNALNLSFILTSGTYFLNVTPIGSGSGRSFDSWTSGVGCIGTPCGNNGNDYFDSNFFGANYQPPCQKSQPCDFSMGVQGFTVPEPPPWAMMAMGAVALIGVQQVRCRKKAP